MDVLLILLAIGGLVVAGVMLVMASRATRLQRESDARVEKLQTLATGSVLFATGAADEVASVRLANKAFDDFNDETVDARWELGAGDALPVQPSPSFEMPAHAHPFVMTVPTGGGRFVGSFDRAHDGSRT